MHAGEHCGGGKVHKSVRNGLERGVVHGLFIGCHPLMHQVIHMCESVPGKRCRAVDFVLSYCILFRLCYAVFRRCIICAARGGVSLFFHSGKGREDASCEKISLVVIHLSTDLSTPLCTNITKVLQKCDKS